MNIWSQEFGDEYQERNKDTSEAIMNRRKLWVKVIDKCPDIKTILEVGAGQGANLTALIDCVINQPDYGDLCFTEVNQEQIKVLRDKGFIQHNWDTEYKYDLVFTSGVLIHTPPSNVEHIMHSMYNASKKYVVFVEYFRPTETMIPYRGMDHQMWGNDFGKIFKALYPDAKCFDCGFMWKETTGLDNVTYWVFQK